MKSAIGAQCQKEFATNVDLQHHKRRLSTALVYELCNAQIKDKATLKDHLDKSLWYFLQSF